jgi:hypothetical protein
MITSALIWLTFDHPLNNMRSEWVARRLVPAARRVPLAA